MGLIIVPCALLEDHARVWQNRGEVETDAIDMIDLKLRPLTNA
jgi:hypothetical protein